MHCCCRIRAHPIAPAIAHNQQEPFPGSGSTWPGAEDPGRSYGCLNICNVFLDEQSHDRATQVGWGSRPHPRTFGFSLSPAKRPTIRLVSAKSLTLGKRREVDSGRSIPGEPAGWKRAQDISLSGETSGVIWLPSVQRVELRWRRRGREGGEEGARLRRGKSNLDRPGSLDDPMPGQNGPVN